MSEDNRPKIIIDDDWKSRVQAEKESLKQSASAQPAGGESRTAQAPAGKAASRGGTATAESAPPLPPASFALIVSTFATEALMALGQFPHPGTDRPAVMLDHAKHFIDTLAVLEEKTKGNLTTEEAAMLEDVLHQLRMAFVATTSAHG